MQRRITLSKSRQAIGDKITVKRYLNTVMREFMFYMTDGRYSTPTWFAAVLADEAGARDMARHRLDESPFHLAVDVVEDDELLFCVTRPQTPPKAGEALP
ncbi:MAG: hypothetical protein JWP35_92 [Caulobacter sp.]|nr:hypothetical protein [Caulobacter sp.]